MTAADFTIPAASAFSISGLSDRVEIIRRDRSDELVGDAAVAADDECFRHAVNAPFDRGAAVAVGAGGGERIAVAAEKAPGVLRLVLVIDADDAQPRILRELHQQRRLVVARHAP